MSRPQNAHGPLGPKVLLSLLPTLLPNLAPTIPDPILPNAHLQMVNSLLRGLRGLV